MLAAGVAHEINNPLTYILYNLESLTEDLPDLIRTIRELQAEIESLVTLSGWRSPSTWPA